MLKKTKGNFQPNLWNTEIKNLAFPLTFLWRKKRSSRVSLKKQNCSTHIFNESGKVEIIAVYLATKSGADISCHNCANYSTSRRVGRWPMALFCVMFYIAQMKANIIWNSQKHEKNMDRFSFLVDLGFGLVIDEMYRFAWEKITSELRILIGSILQKPVPERGKPEVILPLIPERCHICHSARYKKSNAYYNYHKPVYNDHMLRVFMRGKDVN